MEQEKKKRGEIERYITSDNRLGGNVNETIKSFQKNLELLLSLVQTASDIVSLPYNKSDTMKSVVFVSLI